MFLNEKRKVNFNGAILLFSCFFLAGFATNRLSPIATGESNNALPCNSRGSRVEVISSADTKLSTQYATAQPRPPSAYCVWIEGCSQIMSKTPSVRKFETRPFSHGGFNWTLILEPYGSTGQGSWISASVAIDPTGLVGENREVYAQLRFLAYKRAYDHYWTVMDTDARRFHRFQTTWGIPNFLLQVDFTNPNHQYLFDNDQCVFGVDISIFPYYKQWEVVSVDKTVYGPKTWKILNFSTLTRDFYISHEFSVGGKTWTFKVYPNGNGIEEGKSLSLYLMLVGNKMVKPLEKVFVRAKLRVLDQKQSKHLEKPILSWLTAAEETGFEQFVSLTNLQNPANGYIVGDTLSIQVQFEAVSSTNYYSSNASQLMSTF